MQIICTTLLESLASQRLDNYVCCMQPIESAHTGTNIITGFTIRYQSDFKAEDPAEVQSSIDTLEGMIQGLEGNGKKILSQLSH